MWVTTMPGALFWSAEINGGTIFVHRFIAPEICYTFLSHTEPGCAWTRNC